MSKVLLVRHAQSANNSLPEESRVCDPGLTPLGCRQAQALAKSLSNLAVRSLFCSPFLRSLETTRFLADAIGCPIIIRSDLFEQGGCYSGYLPGQEKGEPGLGRSELANRYPGWVIDEQIAESGWWARPYESLEQATERATAVCSWLEQQSDPEDDRTDILVIHADLKRLMLLELLGKSWSHRYHRQLGPLANAGLSILELNGTEWVLHSYNSTSHLRPEEQSR